MKPPRGRCATALLMAAGIGAVQADPPPACQETAMESAKRRAPTAKPVMHKGVRYEQMRRPQEHGFTQAGGVIAAIDQASGKQLWAVQLYQTVFDADEERDAQEVYVSQIGIDAKAGALIATDERKRRWQIELASGRAVQLPSLPLGK